MANLLHDLVALLASGGPAAPDVFCRVLDAVDDEIISTGDTLRPHGAAGDPTHAVAPSVRVKDALRGDADALPKLADVLTRMIAVRIIARGGDATVAVAAAAASTARRYVDWMDVSLFTGEGFVAAAMGLLGSGDATLRAAGADFLTALTSKGMEHAAKVEMIGRLDSWACAASYGRWRRARPGRTTRTSRRRRAPRISSPPSVTNSSDAFGSPPSPPPPPRPNPTRRPHRGRRATRRRR